MKQLLIALIFGRQQEKDQFSYQQWQFTRIFGGMNGITYRAENKDSGETVAVKIRKRDERKRALREFSALQTAEVLSHSIAPKPISLHMNLTQLSDDVVISSWVDGTVLGDLSQTAEKDWEKILDTLATMHSITPNDAPLLRDAVLPIRSTADVIAEIERRFAFLPDGQLGQITKSQIAEIFHEVKARGHTIAPVQDIRLILCDVTPSNMIHTSNGIVIVDWENSGWGDPAFDIADLLVRPECADLTTQTRTQILEYYAEKFQSKEMTQRIIEYEKLMLVFWLILTTNGFIANKPKRFAGTRTFTLEQTRQQQLAYLKRIEASNL